MKKKKKEVQGQYNRHASPLSGSPQRQKLHPICLCVPRAYEGGWHTGVFNNYLVNT